MVVRSFVCFISILIAAIDSVYSSSPFPCDDVFTFSSEFIVRFDILILAATLQFHIFINILAYRSAQADCLVCIIQTPTLIHACAHTIAIHTRLYSLFKNRFLIKFFNRTYKSIEFWRKKKSSNSCRETTAPDDDAGVSNSKHRMPIGTCARFAHMLIVHL